MTTLNVLILDEIKSDSTLEETLKQHHFEVVNLPLNQVNISDIVLTAQPDVIILNLYSPGPKILEAILEINHKQTTPVIIFAEDQRTETINQVIKAGVSAYVVDGYDIKRIKSIIDIALARFKEQQALKDELEKTKNQLEERKFIDRAKGILINSQGYTEEQAYHSLRKLAMDRNISIGEMAKNVISMADLLEKKSV